MAGNVSSPGVKSEERLVGVIHGLTRRRGLSKRNFSIRVTDGYLLLVSEVKEAKKDEEPVRINLSKVKSVSLDPGRSYRDCCDKLQEENGSLEIVTADKKYSFSLSPAYAGKALEVFRKARLIKD